jgi:glucoamylase
MIASLSIRGARSREDEDRGGYHLVWTRDMVNSATGCWHAATPRLPLRALVYLACSQRADGGFYQNFWIDGEPYWRGIQLDEVAFPILLAWRLARGQALREFDPYPMVVRAAALPDRARPATPQERWEENAGYSPSTLASNIAALVLRRLRAASAATRRRPRFLERHADFLECHVERWTVTTTGTLVPGVARHFIRIRPVDPDDPSPTRIRTAAVVAIRNRPPGAPASSRRRRSSTRDSSSWSATGSGAPEIR